ncbi:MAG: rhamnulokinase, partial [Acidobacteria bacterium]|nr:rhamnulokinase [Acidobacteriota bacterium]
MSTQFLAFDLGAESGRAMLGTLRSGVLDLAEIARFPNAPVRQDGSLRWDILSVWREMTRTLERLAATELASLGVDAWGCDYALIGERGNLLENPFHYRDRRTDGIMEAVWERVPRDEIYSITGIQFLPFNTLYQVFAACRQTPKLMEAATTLVTIPDLLNYWLTGRHSSEFTIATTTQFIDARRRTWAVDLLARLGIPTRLLAPLVEPGTDLGPLKRDVCGALAGTPVIAPACHDTASAVAAVPHRGATAFLSSGTWSLLGAEIPRPVISPQASGLNFSNEGGVCGTTRLLKNIGGLWLLQSCRQCWADLGQYHPYEDLVAAAADDRHSFLSLFDPDDRLFFHPDNMVSSIA